MKRKLMLNGDYYPNVFHNAGLVPPTGMSAVDYAKQQMIEALNTYNPKLMVEAVEWGNIGAVFPNVKMGKSTGLLVEEEEITLDEIDEYEEKGFVVRIGSSGLVARRIMMYVFVSLAGEDARNTFVSQTIFPTLLDYMEDYLDSPSYTPANHPFCFLNILNKQITSKMIQRHIAGLTRLGVHYVEVFATSFHENEVPDDLKEYLEKFNTDFGTKYDAVSEVYEGDYFRVDFRKKVFYVKTEELENKIEVTPKGNSFQGSSEKFYWIEMYPIAVWAYDLGYQVNYALYENFCNSYRGGFPAKSDKFKRCETLLRYFRKYLC